MTRYKNKTKKCRETFLEDETTFLSWGSPTGPRQGPESTKRTCLLFSPYQDLSPGVNPSIKQQVIETAALRILIHFSRRPAGRRQTIEKTRVEEAQMGRRDDAGTVYIKLQQRAPSAFLSCFVFLKGWVDIGRKHGAQMDFSNF